MGSRWDDQPLDFVSAPKQYPEPDWVDCRVTVARIYVPQDDTVGWLLHSEWGSLS